MDESVDDTLAGSHGMFLPGTLQALRGKFDHSGIVAKLTYFLENFLLGHFIIYVNVCKISGRAPGSSQLHQLLCNRSARSRTAAALDWNTFPRYFGQI